MSKASNRNHNPASLRVAVVTGTRAEFGLLEPVLRAMKRYPRLQPRLIATGMHLLAKFGRTVDQIRKAGWHVDATVRMQTEQDKPGDEPQALARGISGMARALDRLNCQIVLVLGDRIEVFAAACAATASRRILAHIHGGDRALGELDDIYRDAVSRMAHLHLAASREAVARLRRMGESASRISLVGAPGLDDIRTFGERQRAAPSTSRRRLEELIGPMSQRPYAVVIQHPIGRSDTEEAASMRRTLQAVQSAGLGGVIIYPNSDRGHAGIIREIHQWQTRTGWRVFRSLPREDYLCLAGHSAALVGNSSSGIIESASLGIRAVNVGPRQDGRLRCGPGVIDTPDRMAAIRQAVRRAIHLPRPDPKRSVYGDGRAGQRIAAILGRLRLRPTLLKKRLTY